MQSAFSCFRPAASASLAALLLTVACGGSAAPTATKTFAAKCAEASGSQHAFVVVEHQSGTVLNRCVGFDSTSVPAADLMRRSGIEFQTQAFSFGLGVCQIDNEPAHFNQCLPQGAPYWALWISKQHGPWQVSQTGVSDIKLANGDALGWHYVPASQSNPFAPPEAPRS